MSKEDRRSVRPGSWLLPAIVVCAAALLLGSAQSGRLKPATLQPVNLAGLALMALGLIAAVAAPVAERRRGESGAWKLMRLGAVLVCGVGAMMVFL